MIDWNRRATPVIALLVFLTAVVVYFITLTPTVPFWDAGEFIAVSYILGIPHPPGTPFYVLLGRIATLIPWHTVAERVNALSAVPAALAVMLTYLTGLKLARLAIGESSTVPPWMAHAGAVVGALMLAFSDSYWENAIEAEVYALMSLAQILVLWLGLRWWEEHERRPTAGPLLVAVYVMWLCVGLHLGVGIMGLPLMLLMWLVDRRAAVVFAMPVLTVVLVTMGLERMAGGVLLFSVATFAVFAWQKKLDGKVLVGALIGAVVGMGVAFGDQPFNTTTALVAIASVIVPMVLLARRGREGRVMLLALLLMVVGYSTHAYLPIRARLKPAINEGNPADWNSLRDLLERKQYGQMNMLVRRGDFVRTQLDKEFWRYFRRQWPVFSTAGLENRVALERQAGRSNPLADRAAAIPWGALLPLALGLAGGAWLMQRNGVSFLYTACFLGLTTAGMIMFLNFSDNEVRERDYFFQSGYHAYTLWIGLGAAWLLVRVRELAGARPLPALATALALLAMPFLMMKTLWYTHDRRGNYVARDYAYNMLAPLAPNAYMFTNGDNDTFPLWYIQQVEGFRQDVRVVNLSLLNTDWYIRQLRDEEPKVPIQLGDDVVKVLGMGAVRDTSGRVIYTNEFMVRHIMAMNDSAGRWKKPPYFAVTVPEHMGFDPQFSLEGLVYRVNPDTLGPQIDVEATRKALYETFRYRGLFLPDGTWDPAVYKDENAATLSRNYMAAHLQLAFLYRRRGQLGPAIEEMERVSRMFPDYTDALIPLGTFYLENGDTTKAMDLFKRLATEDPMNPEAHYQYGMTMLYQSRLDEALREFENAIRVDPDFSMAYFAAFYALAETGQQERATGFLERYVARNPNDAQAQALLQAQRQQLQAPGSRPLIERPPSVPLP